MEPITFQLCKRTASFFYVQNELPVSTYTGTFRTGSATIEELILGAGGQGDTLDRCGFCIREVFLLNFLPVLSL